MTQVSTLFMLIAIAPYLGAKFGRVPVVILGPFILYRVFKAYQYYKNKARENNITYTKALESDLPDMSPIHYVLFMLIAAPIFGVILGADLKGFVGVAVV